MKWKPKDRTPRFKQKFFLAPKQCNGCGLRVWWEYGWRKITCIGNDGMGDSIFEQTILCADCGKKAGLQ